ncbi:MAG: amidase family protein [Acidobacteriota bacterium]|nr:amidase family protein [Acidobacteriota bacterium]
MNSKLCPALVLTFGIAACGGADETGRVAFRVEEATIAQIHEAMEAGDLRARDLVEAYLVRIEEYDRRGPALNALVTVNQNALTRAAELDAAFAERGLTGPLHGIPVIVKDNYDIAHLPTSAGSLALAHSVAPDDAFQVRMIRDAGGIVLAKSNMAEFAFSPYETVGSRLPGYTRNPYALNRVTAGSSGGTAAAVAASFGTVGLGTDTGNSIRGPAAHQALVGIRSTMGLTSRDGIVPLNLARDIGGPIARTVADAVAVLDVIAGHDPADPVTTSSLGRPVGPYADALRDDGLRGARLGVLREMSDETADPEVIQRFDEAIADLRRLGALVVDPVALPESQARPNDGSGRARCSRFRFDLNAYLASLGPNAPVKTLSDIVASRQVHPTIRQRLASGLEVELPPDEQPGCAQQATRDEQLRARVRAVLGEHELDALIFPTWDNPPRLIGDLNSPHGNNSQQLSPPTGFPALSVPMGYVGDGLPVGLQILGDAWSEQTLIAIAYTYEQGTRHRVAPSSTPSLD